MVKKDYTREQGERIKRVAFEMYELLKEIRNADLEMSQTMEAQIEIILRKVEK